MRKIIFTAVLAILAACSRMPQVHYYSFDLDAPARLSAASGGTLWLQPFSALPPCDQDRLVYRDSAYEIHFDAYRRWIAPPPELLHEQLATYLRASGRYAAVVTARPRQTPFVSLSIQLVRFDEQMASGERHAATRLWFELTDEAGLPLKSGYITGQVPLTGGGADALVAGMRASAAQAFAELLERL